MATVQVAIVNRALRLIGVLPAGKTANATDSADVLVALNAMLDVWRLEKLMVYAFQEESLTLTAGAASKTIGPSGDLVSTRPVGIEEAWVLDGSSLSHPVTPMEESEYAGITNKSQAGDWPSRFLYRGTMPNATIVTWPVANTSRTMKLLTRVPLAAMALSDTVSLAPGFEDAIVFNLAVRIAPEYETAASAEVAGLARGTKGAIKSNNIRMIPQTSELDGVFPGGCYSVFSDTYFP